ncbi:MAG: adenosylmethionine--8-amino-7-oxononanoate transaminase [Elusimicrobia bacterium RIFCSPLOWO2_01_FULL_60_11]|nr:MAG: adenosylmethionine--8-amino-7-oxononanoate transaminase [Elusimicrobia bacterium RIFCSPLOWO2_01_FULL_60_11]
MPSLAQLDRKVLWHPFTQQTEWEKGIHEDILVISRGRGAYLYDSKGKRYFDAVSSLWVNLFGHNEPSIDRAVERQLKRVAHSTFLGLTHEPGIRLAKELLAVAPKNLSRVFYSDNGSTAVEVALKMAFQYHAQAPGGRTRSRFLTLKNSYHGDTLGAVSVGGIGLFHKKFRPLLFKNHTVMSPHCAPCPHNKRPPARLEDYEYRGEDPRPGDSREKTACRWECLGQAEAVLKKHSKEIAATVVEPVVQGAGGMLTAPPGYLKGLSRLCRKYRVLLIVDEVATGFGRTGKVFACGLEDVLPDILCAAKGISGGYLPLAATLATEKIYNAFLGRYEDFKTFFHGHSYTGNPLACSAGLASLALLKKRLKSASFKGTLKAFRDGLARLSRLPRVRQARSAGLMAGVEIVGDEKERAGKKICMKLREYGVLMRPLGNVLVLVPPLSSTSKEIGSLMDRVSHAIREH